MQTILIRVLLCGLAAAVASLQAGRAESNSSVEALHRLFESAWERQLQENPSFASRLGDRRYNDRWEDRSLEAIQKSHDLDRETLARLRALSRDDLPPAEQLNYDLFERFYEDRVQSYGFREFVVPLNQRGGVQTAHELAEALDFGTTRDYEDWLARLRTIEVLVEQTMTLMRTSIAGGYVPPRIIMERIPDQIAAQIVQEPADSPFYAPFRKMPETIGSAEADRLSSEARAAIRTIVVPAYERFHTFFEKEYLPVTRRTVGIWDWPEGGAIYQHRIKHFTTTELSADDIHEIGLAEVERIRAEMQKIIRTVEFEGSFDEFLHFLRTDEQFYFDNPDDLLEAYLATSKRIDPELVKLFGRLPRMPYGVRAIPAISAPDTTTAYYNAPAADGSRAGYYYVNLYRPEVRPKYEIEVLTVHEAVPGHHLQIALSQELDELPAFRRFMGQTAFVEGWALYSESLGEELGLYQDPYSKFGQLTYEMWRAVRLVVDTGIHHKRWSRQRAIAFFKANAAKTEHDIVNEIDRYIAWPGQALAYKIGELKIKALRRRSEEQLGDRFDIKGFHDTVLANGAIPLDVLEQNILGWIETRRAHTAAADRN